jgi:hypothetical protein
MATNAVTYGLDASNAAWLQPELLDLYRRISRRWQEWLGLMAKEANLMDVVDEDVLVTTRKRAEEPNHITGWNPTGFQNTSPSIMPVSSGPLKESLPLAAHVCTSVSLITRQPTD